MSRLRMFFRCIGEAVCARGLKAVATLVPFGDAIYEIADETYKRMKASMRQEEELAAIAAAAQATLEETKREAVAAVQEIAQEQQLSPEVQINLVRYLSQVPSAVRQTMKRPSDPSGKTVPSSFTIRKPEQLVTMLPSRLPSFKPGDRPAGIGNWELVEQLGAGGFGEVWLARHPSLHGLTAALKFCLDPEASSTLRHEASLLDRVMQQSRHPGIVALRQAYLDSTPLCLEYEYVNGGDLTALIGEWQRGAKVPRAQVNLLVHRLAEIVGHAHKLTPPIVHRDLKPANILLERDPDGKIRLRVTDFGIGGIAATQALQGTKRGSSGHNEVLATALRGAHTPHYASPQQVRGEAPDPRDDVHALGVIWYQMLTGDLTTGVPADWMTVLEDVEQPPELIKLLGSCVTSRPEKRLANAAVLAEQLDALLNPAKAAPPAKEEEAIPVAEMVEDDVPEAIPAPPVRTARPARPQTPTVRPPLPPPVTQRPAGQTTQRGRPAEDDPEPPRRPRQSTQRGVRDEDVYDDAPRERERDRDRGELSRPRRDRGYQPQPNNQYRRFDAVDVPVGELKRDLTQWLRGEGFRCQDLRTEQGGTLIQIEQEGGWRKFVGMSSALNIILTQEGDDLHVEIGAGQWIDKAAAGVVSLLILWPLAVTAAIGAWNQMQLPERIFSRVTDLVYHPRRPSRRREEDESDESDERPVRRREEERPALPPARPPAGMSPEKITELRELAALRDQGILTEEEFQAEKSRILGH